MAPTDRTALDVPRYSRGYGDMEPDRFGQWVRYDDYERACKGRGSSLGPIADGPAALTSKERLQEAREMLTVYAANLDRAWSSFMVLSDTGDVWKSKLRSELDRVQRWLAQSDYETSEKPFAGLLSWGLRPCLPHCELSIRFESVETAQAAREKIRNLIAWQYRSSEKSNGDQP